MNEEETQDLAVRNAELEAENERLIAENKLFRTEHKIAGGFATLVLAGPSLVKAFRKWFHVMKREKEVPVDESADLAAAVTRRLINVGIIGLFFASILPAGLLLWQNTLIRDQNQYFREQIGVMQKQNEYFQEQNKVILDDSTRARRAQLIATIYDKQDCGEGESCPPKAHVRSRYEAALALAAIDRSLGKKPSLAYSNLQKADLRKANLEGMSLEEVDLWNANLWEANLRGASMRAANLTEAFLQDADLTEATLYGARLPEAYLVGADLGGALLGGANLRGTNLRGVQNLSKEQIAEALIDVNTELPDYLMEYKEELLEITLQNEERLAITKEKLALWREDTTRRLRDQSDRINPPPFDK